MIRFALIPTISLAALFVFVPARADATSCEDVDLYISTASSVSASDQAAAYVLAGNVAFACGVESHPNTPQETRAYRTAGDQYMRAAELLAGEQDKPSRFAYYYLAYNAYGAAVASNKRSQLYPDDELRQAESHARQLARAYRSWV